MKPKLKRQDRYCVDNSADIAIEAKIKSTGYFT